MNSHGNWRWVALAAVALAIVVIPANSTHAGSTKKIAKVLEAAAIEQFGDNDGPAFLLVSIADPLTGLPESEFQTPFINQVNGRVLNEAHEMGSTVALIKTGYVIAGFEVETTRFEGDNSVPAPDLGGAIIDGHQATFIGGFRTHGDGVIHVATPSPEDGPEANPIPVAVQEAYFNASRMFEQAQMLPEGDPGHLPAFPTTVELACFIYKFGMVDVDVNEVMQSLFVGDMSMECGSPCLAEGDLFGHQPSPAILFFRGLFDDDDDTLKLDIGRRITFDIKPGNSTNPLNLGSEGVVPTGIFSEADGTRLLFDAAGEIDVTTIRAVVFDSKGFELASIPVDKTSVTDLDDDGNDDLMVHFRTQLLVDLIDFEQTVTVNFRANTQAEGMELSGSSDIRVVPKK